MDVNGHSFLTAPSPLYLTPLCFDVETNQEKRSNKGWKSETRGFQVRTKYSSRKIKVTWSSGKAATCLVPVHSSSSWDLQINNVSWSCVLKSGNIPGNVLTHLLQVNTAFLMGYNFKKYAPKFLDTAFYRK